MRDWAILAEIVGTKTLSGGLVVHGATSLSFVLVEGLECAFIPPQLDLPRKGSITSVRQIKEDSYLVHFDSVDSIEIAEGLVGCFCLARRSDLPEDFGEEELSPLQGYRVIDRLQEELGSVITVLEHPLQSRIVIEGALGEFSVPLVDEYIVSIDEEEACVVVDLPTGYLEALGVK